ncbi:hypothetical protein D0Z00_003775 [Geotrichum galactomycetum]|uniref:Uncharacterized protein n=1 Tax=Geotrichum galactomycetum TaxID=27317 RepID=A0ACB6V099_9ASCO|nr:hypothetical protein D0Z00_003775 [Geotrichum candidum]
MIHFALGPYFEASSQISAAAQETANATLTSKSYQDKESLGAIPTTRRKIAELELSLLHLQQNIEIPELTLNLHPIIDKALESNLNSEPSIDLIPAEYLSDTDFLNSLQSIVNGWIKSIQGITRMSRDPDSGTAAQEINFWLSMETALKHIENQLQGPGVTLTLNVLRNAKRFHATVSFLSDTGIKEASEKIAKYNQLMRDFPLDELISATTLNSVQKALLLIFGHINKKLRITPYPVRRALSLVEGISDDLNNSLQTILGGLRLVHLDYTAFNQTVQLVHEIFHTWDEQMKEFTNIAREMTRKRAEKFIPIRINARHLKTKERLDYITSFRIRHQELRDTLAKVLGSGHQVEGSIPVGFDGINPLEEISSAYDILKQVNVLDISEEKEYNERTTRVENAIIAMLRDRLATAKTSNEMFRVFSKFNALFVRASIRGAIQEYQSRLIDNVKADISALHDRFRQQYSNSEVYEIEGSFTQQETFSDIPLAISDDISKVYFLIDYHINNAEAYLDNWYQFQALWDLESSHVFDILGEDMAKWLQILTEIRKARSTFDTTEVYKNFGLLRVDFRTVQVRINAKYDGWQQEIILKFSQRLNSAMKDLCAEIERLRRDLENQTLDSFSTDQVVATVTKVQHGTNFLAKWESQVSLFRNGQTTLSRYRFRFPSSWLFIDQVDSEWNALKEILGKKSAIIESQLDGVRVRVQAEMKRLTERIISLEIQWEEDKPIAGSLRPTDALKSLAKFENEATSLLESSELLSNAASALELDFKVSSNIVSVIEEIRDFNSVWAALESIWNSLNDLRESPWASVVPRKIRKSLEDLVEVTKGMPTRIRQYAAFEHIQNVLKNLIKSQTIVIDLKTEAIHERHWQKLYKNLAKNKRLFFNSMTLGDVWDMELLANTAFIKDVVTEAQGELALEIFLRQVRQTWTTYNLELTNYKNTCRLIKGWDELFQTCGDHLNSLSAMHHSHYFKVFEEEARGWEEKLNRIHVLFDVWIDVQRQWVYLEGVFNNNAEIKHILPVESSRFQSINSEFFVILRKVYKSPLIIDVLNIPGVQQSIERLADLLGKVQKALGEYYEQERQRFARFYFIGDEDLLEIIGNSNDIHRVEKHLNKMFAGIAGLIYDQENSTIDGVRSKEGEEVFFTSKINLVKIPNVVEWLIRLEEETKITLSNNLSDSIETLTRLISENELSPKKLMLWIQTVPSQISIVTSQIIWTRRVEEALDNQSSLEPLQQSYTNLLQHMATFVLQELSLVDRKKCENLITELIHQRDIISQLISEDVSSASHFTWQSQLAYHFDTSEPSPTKRLIITQAQTVFTYGFEYLGMPDRLVSTPLVDNFFLAMTQALEQRLGGSPFGPAGTGKTESVKALGQNLGKFVLVFCCDESFDFQAIGRILAGICQVGAWGCFDEFNRLNEQILSSVSMQIEAIELGIKAAVGSETKSEIELANRTVALNDETGIFITMNPEYAGRNTLPENLKKLFRSFSMAKPDKEIIAEVLLNSQGFVHAKKLSKIVVPFFTELQNKLSYQVHYDFGLRALKNVLATSGNLKRSRLGVQEEGDLNHWETSILLQCLRETVAPKLIAEDAQLMFSIEQQLFPGVEYLPFQSAELETSVRTHASKNGYIVSDEWLTKVFQLYQFQKIHHGIMLVGSSGFGKSTVYQSLLSAMQEAENVECIFHLIDAKVMSKEALFGSLDSTTREWTDGLFTATLRRIVDNLRGEDQKQHWIVFDGDVDPEWAENLNSVLDDNKILTLPNGERIALPNNVRIAFEVENLKYATPATISRCGMIWFGPTVVTAKMQLDHFLFKLRKNQYDDVEEDLTGLQIEEIQNSICDHITNIFSEIDLDYILGLSKELNHIMEFTETRALNTVFALINSSCLKLLLFLNQNADYRPTLEQQQEFITKSVLLALVWALAGDCPLADREEYGLKMLLLPVFAILGIEASNQVLVDYDVSLPDAKWEKWEDKVPHVSLDTHSIIKTDVVIPTIDTMRHESLIYGLLNAHKPIVLCGPPGSGKTMTLFGALRKLPNLDVVGLNFSKATTPSLLIKSLEQHCEYKKTMKGTILSPSQIGRWLVVFCDEINLPAIDKYGTQTAISLLRQMIEQQGFWSPNQQQWVTLSRIQFVGACNPPTDIGRNELNQRFLRHSAVILVDYPGKASLHQIYESFNSAVLKSVPTLRGYASILTSAMIEFYTRSQERFLSSEQTHYVYSPRELTRWVRGIYEAIHLLDVLPIEGLVRIWAHEALRLFHDRLAKDDERAWTHGLLQDVAYKHFLNVDLNTALKMPILYSNWLTKDYLPVNKDELKAFVKARMRTFCEEDLDKPLILYDDLLDHVLRIDRVLRQPQGHLILIGVSGSGKATLSRFVAWMNGIKVVQLKTTRKYGQEEFDADLRHVLKRAGTNGEKICFVLDESNILESAFLERMNTLLANGEVPGLFEGDDYTTLMTACKEGALRQGFNLDSQDELYKWFTGEIVRNLHVIFTMNPPDSDLSSHSVASPALFNRCVLNWMGDWSDHTLLQVASSITDHLDIDRSTFEVPKQLVPVSSSTFPVDSYRASLVNAMVYIHKYAIEKSNSFSIGEKRNVVSPGDFLDYLRHFVDIFNEKSEELEDQQRHFNVGLDKLRDTVLKVRDLKTNLAEKKSQLENKSQEAKEMLRQMISDQSEAERKRESSIKFQNSLRIQEEKIASRQEIVMNDLNKAEPAVIEAQNSVRTIQKQYLTELRSMLNPPETVKLVLDSVCTLLGYRATTWKEIQSYVRRDDFISSILKFDSDSQMSPQLRHKIETEFLSLPNLNFKAVNRASNACGPLLQWVEAQVTYSSILERVGPLREEVKALQDEAVHTKSQAKNLIAVIEDLEASIEKYKEDYAQLITDTQAIKSEMVIVENKVNRSVNLLDSLSDERNRWSANIKEFEHRKDALPGDVLLSAAFISYSGYYDQQIRDQMSSIWADYLSQSGISYQKHNSVSNYLATGEERLKWHNSSLPPDDLCVENAIMLCRYHRYPLIIDPTARVIPFLVAQHEKKKLTITSFLDDAFIKHLESAIRFGNPILIQDAEYLDSVLTQVLNKEYKRTGGRTLIELGNQDIDFSKDFQLYLLTRDPTVTIAPHISSRTTVVNFTITRNSLASQALNQVLQAERPEVEEKRLSLIKLHGEYKVHLRQLETNLLQALNESEGNILDHDGIVDTLEKLKVEAVEVTTKVKETDAVMDTIESVMQQYRPLAEHCGKIFAILDKLFLINSFYQFSLEYFLTIFSFVLQEKPAEDAGDRVEDLIKRLYQETYRRTSLSLLNKDKPVLLLLLAQAFSPEIDSETLHKVLRQYSVKSVDYHETGWFSKVENILDEFGSLNSVDSNEKSLTALMQKEAPELSMPRLWDESISAILDRSSVKCETVALGSKEGNLNADTAIVTASQRGTWVLIQNVHLSPQWLESLEKHLKSTRHHPNFRLLLTMQINTKVPTTLLRVSSIIMFEPPWGMKASMQSSFKTTSAERISKLPIERGRLYFLLSWFHAIIQERERFTPIGWSKIYDFNDSDFESGLFVVDSWINSISKNRSNISPLAIPWQAIQRLFTDIVYGGKIDRTEDLEVIQGIVSKVFVPEAYNLDYSLVQDMSLPGPEGSGMESFEEWIQDLPERQPPEWLGLPHDAENSMIAIEGENVASKAVKIIEAL